MEKFDTGLSPTTNSTLFYMIIIRQSLDNILLKEVINYVAPIVLRRRNEGEKL